VRFLTTDTERGRVNKRRGVEFKILQVFLFQLARFIIMDTVRALGNVERQYTKEGRCGKRITPILEETDTSGTG
jgi:hypothetical protein